jgi:hypothetical protein
VQVAHCMQSLTFSPLSSLSCSIDLVEIVWAVIVSVMFALTDDADNGPFESDAGSQLIAGKRRV